VHIAAIAVQHSSQFWPTVNRVVTVLAAIGGGGATYIGRRNHIINQEIKIAVNGEFAAKVRDLAVVTADLKMVTAQRDKAISDNAKEE
jgi:hypothetical protein